MIDVDNKEKRTPQTCALCRNHGSYSERKGHKFCIYENDHHLRSCNECQNTLQRRQTGAREIQLRRKRSKEFVGILSESSKRRRQAQNCRKCRNHGVHINITGGHKNSCPRQNCPCVACKDTENLRKSMKHENKHKRIVAVALKTESEDFRDNESLDSGFNSATNSPYSQFSNSERHENDIEEQKEVSQQIIHSYETTTTRTVISSIYFVQNLSDYCDFDGIEKEDFNKYLP